MPSPSKDLSLGGQAVLEGVMMRSPSAWAVAVRTPAGDIDTHRFELDVKPSRLRQLPVLRGVLALGGSLKLGVHALHLSAQAQLPEKDRKRGTVLTTITAFVSLAVGIALFFMLPAWGADLLREHLPSSLAFVLAEKAMRFALFFAYLALVSKREYVRRVFEYHGAEHKAIACQEAGQELTPENAQRYSRFHPRCGTSFVLLVLIVSTFLFALLGRPEGWELFASRLIGLPLVAGVSFEVLKLMARHENHPVAKVLIAPGLMLQRITTREPDRAQLQVAIAALRAV